MNERWLRWECGSRRGVGKLRNNNSERCNYKDFACIACTSTLLLYERKKK